MQYGQIEAFGESASPMRALENRGSHPHGGAALDGSNDDFGGSVGLDTRVYPVTTPGSPWDSVAQDD
jgi:hypothetical protein